MRSLTSIFLTIVIALSICLSANGTPQTNPSTDWQLRQLEARYDTLSSLHYTNAYIEAEKRVLEAKIEKLKHTALSSKSNSEYKSSSQSGSSAAGLSITGPKDLNNDPKDSPLWSVTCDEFINVNDDATCISDIQLFGRTSSYPMFSIDITNLWNEQLHTLNLSVWNGKKEMRAKLTFDSENIFIKVVVFNQLKDEFKEGTECASMRLIFVVEPSDAKRIYTALTSKTLRSMTIGEVLIPLDQFTDSKAIFRALLNRLGSKVSKARDL